MRKAGFPSPLAAFCPEDDSLGARPAVGRRRRKPHGVRHHGRFAGLNERNRAVGALVGAGVDARTQLVVGIAASSVEEAIAQGRAGLMLGCPSFLLAPPFYFKGAADEGLFDWFAAVLMGLGPKASNVILYHIPQVTSVGLSMDLVGQLKKAFPQQVTGVKDSSGDWENAQALLKHHSELHILIGDERLLAKAMTLGASGTICGLANIAPDLMRPINGIEEPRIAKSSKLCLRFICHR